MLDYALAGTFGALIVRGAEALGPRARPATRRLLVRSVAQGIVLTRRLEEAAEETRLRAGDVLAEARAHLGEEAPPPAPPGATHDHDHERHGG